MRAFLIFFIFMFLPLSARAATCDPGYYLDNDVCTMCLDEHYCPGDDTMYECPAITYTNDELIQMITDLGYDVNSFSYAIVDTNWANKGWNMKSVTQCVMVYRYVNVAQGVMSSVGFFYSNETNNYTRFGTIRWASAKPGYYLSGNRKNGTWSGIKPCTNPYPTNAHYSGPGTPDSVDGTIVDANDCPWVCDDGYYNDNGTCTLCPAGYACANGKMINCANVTGANGRKTYAAAGAASCSECPEASEELVKRKYGYNGWWQNDIHNNVSGCEFYFWDNDPDATFIESCYYDTTTNTYGGGSARCEIRTPTACVAGKYSTIASDSTYNDTYNYMYCAGIGCGNGRVCTDVGAGYFSPEGDTARYACDTPPANAHITVACTPGANSVWQCDSGYGRTANDTCEPLCAAGITQLRTSTGLIYNLYANQLTSPAIHIKQNDITCYVNLTPGGATGAINIRNNGTVYHATN